LGLLWSFGNPLLLLVVYTFVFGSVLRVSWTSKSSDIADLALFLYAGLVLHQFLSEVLNSAPSLIVNNPNYVKKVVFPLEVLSCSSILAALFHLLAGLSILLIFFGVLRGIPPSTVLIIPLVILPFAMLALAVSWAVSAVAVYVRDVAQATGMLSTLLLFLSPVFYPAEAIPMPARALLAINPLTFPVEAIRGALLRATLPDPLALVAFASFSLLCAALAQKLFHKLRGGFADVL
jgi:lipopolysaccharide transport system permease protein